MHPLFKITVSITPLLIFAACSTTPKKNTTTSLHVPRTTIPTSPTDPLNTRTEADYNYIVGELYGLEDKSSKAIESFERVLEVDDTSPALHMRLAAEYLKIDNMTKALFYAEKAVAKAPKNIEARLLLGGLYSAEKMFDQAIAQYNTVLRLQPKNEEAPIYIGSLYAEKKDFKKAEKYFKSLLKNPNYETPHVAHYYLGLILINKNAFKKALQLKPDYEDAVISLANLYLQQKKRIKALTLCLEFQKQNRFSHNVADLITQIYIEDERSDKAYEQLEFTASNSESTLSVEMKMALILIEQKRLSEAESKLKEIVVKFPDSDSAHYYLAAIYDETGSKENAIKEYMMVPPSSSHFSDAVIHAAHLLKNLGKLNQALEVTEKGLKSKVEQPQLYTMHASILDAKSDYLGATQVLEQGLTKFSQNTGLLFQYAVMLDRIGKKDEMIAQMKRVLEIEPDHVESMSYLAFSFAELNQHLLEAEKLARRAWELHPTDAYVLDTLGWVLFKQKKYTESIQILEKAYAFQSSASIIAEHLADAYSMQLMTEKAKNMYTTAAKLTTNEARAKQILNKLGKLDF